LACTGWILFGIIRSVDWKEMTTIRHSLLVAVVAGMLFSGCATDTGRKTAVGSGIGAAVGAIIGNQSGEAKNGALLGAGVGGLIGVATGKAKEAKENQAANPKE